MRLAVIAFGLTVLLAVALTVQAIVDSAVGGWIAFGAVFTLGLAWSFGVLPGGGTGLRDGG